MEGVGKGLADQWWIRDGREGGGGGWGFGAAGGGRGCGEVGGWGWAHVSKARKRTGGSGPSLDVFSMLVPIGLASSFGLRQHPYAGILARVAGATRVAGKC